MQKKEFNIKNITTKFLLAFTLAMFAAGNVVAASLDAISSKVLLKELSNIEAELFLFSKQPMNKDGWLVLKSPYIQSKSIIDCNLAPNECRDERLKRLGIHLIVLNIIDQLHQPAYDPYDWKTAPRAKVWPPEGSVNGIVFGPVNPDRIKDKKLRAEYLENIKANEDRKINYSIQTTIEGFTQKKWPESNNYILDIGIEWLSQDICDIKNTPYVRKQIKKVIKNTDRQNHLLLWVDKTGDDYRAFCISKKF